MTRAPVSAAIVLAIAASAAYSQIINNEQVTVAPLTEAGKTTGFTLKLSSYETPIAVRFGSLGNMWAGGIKSEKEGGVQRLVFSPLVSSPTPQLDPSSQVAVEVRQGDP
ncbi:MAG: hypothetical protein H5T86_08230, partial [Armatimonadetes bacterium]|nr:hypothetical protein [Armatimonadota bacterium]